MNFVSPFSRNTRKPYSFILRYAVPLTYAEECLKLLTVDSVFAFRIGE